MALNIDILKMEIARRLPHWLSWRARNADHLNAIRTKHRLRWLAGRDARKNDLPNQDQDQDQDGGIR